jgi:hypothetical protein
MAEEQQDEQDESGVWFDKIRSTLPTEGVLIFVTQIFDDGRVAHGHYVNFPTRALPRERANIDTVLDKLIDAGDTEDDGDEPE